MFPGDFADGEIETAKAVVIVRGEPPEGCDFYWMVGLSYKYGRVADELLPAREWLQTKAKGRVRWRGTTNLLGASYDVFRVYDEHDITLFKLFFYGNT